jgi:murein DD-endopeptidase MepM/ murein hydrolase activator NlpD
VRTLQRRAGLEVDGVAGVQTRAALGRYGRPALGRRTLAGRVVGWDVAQLQFLLAWHGFPSGPLDGHFGPRTEAAVRRFQAWAGLAADGVAGAATLAALRTSPPRSPIALAWPVDAAPADAFGPRGNRFHTGLDFPAPSGAPVTAPGAGRVAYAGRLKGGWGLVVTIAHGSGVRTMHAHLSRVDVEVGDRVAAGTRIGLVGATGHATGPHLHFEVRLRGAAVDPLTAIR